eukprot:COSAG01_NODE_95_length_26957_cov_48.328617_7_plen_133_part_00
MHGTDTGSSLWIIVLRWSRGQNEYGGDIAGPLPRSWMKAQWSLQKQILNRTRALGMVGQLPGFQAAVPTALKELLGDKNMTDNGQGTAWIDSLDPEFLKIADLWMETMVGDFGTISDTASPVSESEQVDPPF